MYIGQLYYDNPALSANSQEMFSTCVVCDIIYIRLKCQLSRDALHGSWSPLNIINISRSYLVDPKPISVAIGAR